MRFVPRLATCVFPALPPCHRDKCKGTLLEPMLTGRGGEGKGESYLVQWEANLFSDSRVGLMLDELPKVSGFLSVKLDY